MSAENMKKTIAGNEYDYTLCPRCGVWIATEDFNEGTHEGCDKYYATKEIRERATTKVLGRLSP